jgi:hypothetical protein
MAKQPTVLRQLVDCGFLSPVKPHIFDGLQDVIDLDLSAQERIANLLRRLCIFNTNEIGTLNQPAIYGELLDALDFPMIVSRASLELPGNTFYTLSIDQSTMIAFSNSKKQFDRTTQKIIYSGGSAPVISKAIKIGRKQIYTALFVSYINFPIFTKN